MELSIIVAPSIICTKYFKITLLCEPNTIVWTICSEDDSPTKKFKVKNKKACVTEMFTLLSIWELAAKFLFLASFYSWTIVTDGSKIDFYKVMLDTLASFYVVNNCIIVDSRKMHAFHKVGPVPKSREASIYWLSILSQRIWICTHTTHFKR